MTIFVHEGDIPGDLDLGEIVAIDTETMGLQPARDRLCVVQLSAGDGDCHLVRFDGTSWDASHLVDLLEDRARTKLFHFARFDVAVLRAYLDARVSPVYCTKIASKLVRTYTDRHSLKELCRELLSVDLSKAQQSSDWGAASLTEAQKNYAAQDVLHLHALKKRLDAMLEREDRTDIARACFEFLPARADLDLRGWPDIDIFAH